MSNQKLSDFTTSATDAAAGDLLLLENAATHKKITFANLVKTLFSKTASNGIVLGDLTQEINTISIQLNQAQIQALHTTPITIIAAPGANKYIQFLGASSNLIHNGTDYVCTSPLFLAFSTVGAPYAMNTGSGYVASGANAVVRFGFSSIDTAAMNDSIEVLLATAATANGGTINISIQYVIRDTV